MPKNQTEPSFEQSLTRLNEIVRTLDDDSTPLSDLLRHYEEGIELVARCMRTLSDTEKKLLELKKRSDGLFETLDAEQP
jgi:exodeoxyribonuclease VII small subunit